MDRREEITKEIEDLEKKIRDLNNEYNNIRKSENPVNVGDVFRELRRISPIYSKIIKFLDNGRIVIIQVTNTSIARVVTTYEDIMCGIVDKSTLEEFNKQYNDTLKFINN